MNTSVAYIFAIVFVVIAINFFLLHTQQKRSRGSRYKKRTRIAVDEAKQALWRDNEIVRRLEREQEGAIERVKLREETLALYDEVRRRAAARESEGALMSGRGWEEMEGDVERFR